MQNLTERSYLTDRFQEIELSESFKPTLDRKGQAKLVFVQAIPGVIEKGDDEYPNIRFMFLCVGAGGAQLVSYTGWLSDAMSKETKIGKILERLGVVEFPESEAVIVEEHDLEAELKDLKPKKLADLNILLNDLEKLEGVVLLAKLSHEHERWYRPIPDTFNIPKNKNGGYHRLDVTKWKK